MGAPRHTNNRSVTSAPSTDGGAPQNRALERPLVSRSPAAMSPQTSRNSSPTRGQRMSSAAYSSPEITPASSALLSPTQPSAVASILHGPPSAAAVARALAAASASQTPQTSQTPHTGHETGNKTPRSSNAENVGGAGASMHWPTSPRLKSPPTSAGPRQASFNSARQTDGDGSESANTSFSSGQDSTTTSSESSTKSPTIGPGQAPMKPARGFSGLAQTLETVEEGDSPSPNVAVAGQMSARNAAGKPRADASAPRGGQEYRKSEAASKDGQGEGAGTKRDDVPRIQEPPPQTSTKPPALIQRASSSNLAPGKARPTNEGSSKNMKVETETVASIPQAATNATAAERTRAVKADDSNSLRHVASSETIRPKKEKKKPTKKSNSIISGTTSSKADLFEAKISSAVDEDTDDSDETFVYESNPPEPRHRQRRHHSRTPSAHSIQSVTERRNGTGSQAQSHSQRGLRGKRSMKFASNSYANNSVDDESGEYEHVHSRAHSRATAPGDHGHHRTRGSSGGPNSPVDQDPLFGRASRRNGGGSRASSRPQSPKNRSPSDGNLLPKGDPPPYDFDPEAGHGERTPLMGAARNGRRRRYQSSNLRHMQFQEDAERSWLRRCTGCCVVTVVILTVILAASAFLVASTKTLYDVEILEIQNVLASEQELMLDLLVQATNPNIATITVTEMDVNIFARSRHLGSDNYVSYGDDFDKPGDSGYLRPWDSVDDGTDPIDDPEGDPQTMLLGRIFQFDSGLVFEGSPMHRIPHNSSGELRLEKPGNKTEEGGSERWEKIIQYPFELIVRGILKYQLPLSNRWMRATVSSSKEIDTDADDKPDGKGHLIHH